MIIGVFFIFFVLLFVLLSFTLKPSTEVDKKYLLYLILLALFSYLFRDSKNILYIFSFILVVLLVKFSYEKELEKQKEEESFKL